MGKPESKQAMTDALADFMNEGGRSVASYGKPVSGGAPAETPAPAGKQQLVEAYDKLVEHEAAKPKEPLSFERPVPAWRKYGVPALGIAAFVATAYLWIGRPKWLYLDVDPPVPPANAEAARRALIAGSIIMQSYRATKGRYPDNFKDAGVTLPWMSIVPGGDGGFTLMTDAGSGRLMLQSTPAAPFKIEGPSR